MTDDIKNLFSDYMRLPTFRLIELTNVDQEGNFGDRPIQVAASRGRTDEIETLLNHGADIDSCGEHGFTALHLAATMGRSEAIRLLLSRGANPLKKNDDGDTPLAIAIASQHDENIPSDWNDIVGILQQATSTAIQAASLERHL